MNYISTRDSSLKVNSSYAIAHGISKEGGLFVPESVPKLSGDDFNKLSKLDYVGRAKYILKYFLTDFSDEELDRCVKGAYKGNFDRDLPAPLHTLESGKHILELWHGPTCAFKDLALQILPFLLTTAANKEGSGKKTVILVATSGDTGKAALEGFKDVENTEIIVFYPENGVSKMQKLQMDSQKGNNVHVCSIKGNFDDAQSGVKKIFTDNAFKEILNENGMQFSSANSINWGRLVPQIVYYVSAYCDLREKNENLEQGFNVAVPTGNFGNILAAYYAKKMGVPIAKLICASNENNVLTDFINTGIYDRNRKFHTTVSPSMDILISSNLERMLFEACKNNSDYVSALQTELSEKGRFTVSNDVKERLQSVFFGGCCDDGETLKTIGETFKQYGYLCDTHTAVAVNVYNRYLSETGDDTPVVIASTASPYKFAGNVLKGIGSAPSEDEFENIKLLSKLTDTEIPDPIKTLFGAEARFNDVYGTDGMYDAVKKYLNI